MNIENIFNLNINDELPIIDGFKLVKRNWNHDFLKSVLITLKIPDDNNLLEFIMQNDGWVTLYKSSYCQSNVYQKKYSIETDLNEIIFDIINFLKNLVLSIQESLKNYI